MDVVAAAVSPSARPIPNWSPGAVSPATSTRPAGLVKAGFAAWRGKAERAEGVPLTAAQVTALAPFLAARMRLSEDTVRGDLQRTRILVGGPAAGAGNVATTIGTNVYVSDAQQATNMLSWNHRWWLAHELTHTMQWRQTSRDGMDDAARDKAFLNRYVGGFVAGEDGRMSDGALLKALKTWLDSRKSQPNADGAGDAIHDAHPMEREANAVADAFRAATS